MQGSLSLLFSKSHQKHAVTSLRNLSRKRRDLCLVHNHNNTFLPVGTAIPATDVDARFFSEDSSFHSRRRHYHATTTTNHHHHFHYSNSRIRAFSTALAPQPHHDDEDDDGDNGDDLNWLDEEIAQLAASSYNSSRRGPAYHSYKDYDTPPRPPRQPPQPQRPAVEPASSSLELELELGEASVWDSPRELSLRQQLRDDELVEEDSSEEEWKFPTFPLGSPAAELHRQHYSQSQSQSHSHSHSQSLQQQQLLRKEPSQQPHILSPLDMLEQLSNAHDGSSLMTDHYPWQLPPQADPLSYAGPAELLNTTTSGSIDVDPTDLRQVQLKLECEAQREAVLKYQKLTDQTRSRKDYASLNSLQKLILHWYQPIRDEIEAVQKEYILKKCQPSQSSSSKSKSKSTKGNSKPHAKHNHHTAKNNKSNNNNTSTDTALNRYGPLINTVDPEKLAVITTHEALTMGVNVNASGSASGNRNNTATSGSDTFQESLSSLSLPQQPGGGGGCPVVAMAQKLGQAVEEEVLLQRILKQHMEQERDQQQQQQQQQSSASDTGDLNPQDESSSSSTTSSTTTATSEATDKRWSYAESRLNSYLQQIAGDGVDNVSPKNRRNIAYAVRRARSMLNTEDWTIEDQVHVGSKLLQILLDHATIRLPDGTVQPAFRMEKRWHRIYHNNNNNNNNNNSKASGGGGGGGGSTRFKSTNVIMVHDALLKLAVADEFESIAATTTRHKPMVIPPEPWTSPDHGGYAWLKTDLIRFHGSQLQREALDQANLTTVFDGLNSLSREPWMINPKILQVAQECWERNIPLGDIPSRTDLEVPPEPTPPERTNFVKSHDNTNANIDDADDEYAKMQKQRWVKEYRSFKESRNRYRRILQKNRDMFSLRCSARLKLGQAEQFKEYDNIYFPYNMDFRGRAYPVPPHLSNVGSDLCRGMLTFAKKKPLGKRGLFWLQVHLANLAGKDKMTFEDRAQYTIDNLDNVRKSVEDPFAGLDDDSNNNSPDTRPWWMSLDDPFQGLATCHEIIHAIDSGNPETYMCSLPVHMDGSCNGLQHYAALGRDLVGGTAVNLCNYEEPQDVYIGVMEEVIRRVAEEAAKDLPHDEADEKLSKEQRKALAHNRSAKLVNGLIDRGVVKRTVMTSVYGVTYIGARHQIQEKIEEKLEEQGRDLDEINFEIFRASGYLAEVTMSVIGELFTGAKQTMNWLTQCARLVSSKGYPVAWITPLGLPAIQPYRQKRSSRIVTALSSIVVADYSDDLPIHKSRSVSAFPPNYIHSLDSTHMLMTALEMNRRGLSFSAVHDSFWTHPCDIDEMNEALRDTFVELYSQPLLEELKASFEMRYPDITFPDLPEKGVLNLEEVKQSKFFFQ